MSKGTVTELRICGRIVRLGDKLRVKYSDGSGYISGEVTELWSPEKGKHSQGRLSNGWCFHNHDTIIDDGALRGVQ